MPRLAWLLLALVLVTPAADSAAATPARRSAEGRRAFLSVPIWYIDFEMEVDLKDASSHYHSLTWTRSGLDMRNQGPLMLMDKPTSTPNEALLRKIKTNPGSLTRAEIEAISRPGAAILAQIDDAANWVEGPATKGTDLTYDESARQAKAWMDSTAAHEDLAYNRDSDDSHEAVKGIGRVWPQNEVYHFEVDVAKAKFAMLLPTFFVDTESSVLGAKGQLRALRVQPKGGLAWETEPIAKGLAASMPTFTLDTPVEKPGLIIGNLPEALGPVQASVTYPITAYGTLHGTLTVRCTASPNPPRPIELVFKVPGRLSPVAAARHAQRDQGGQHAHGRGRVARGERRRAQVQGTAHDVRAAQHLA